VQDEASAEAHVAAMCRSLGLSLTEAQRSGTERYVRLAAGIARPLLAFPLGDELEAAPVFRADGDGA